MNNPIIYDIEGHKVELLPWVEHQINKDNSALVLKDTKEWRQWIEAAETVSEIRQAEDGSRTLCVGFRLGPVPALLGTHSCRPLLRFEVALPKLKPWWRFWR